MSAAFLVPRQRAGVSSACGTARGWSSRVSSTEREKPLLGKTLPAPQRGLSKRDSWRSRPDTEGYTQLSTRDEDTDLEDKAENGAVPSQGGRSMEASEDGKEGTAVLDTTLFHCVSVTAIVLNSVLIGFETDYPDWECWDHIESGFLVYFTLELMLRIYVQGARVFFLGKPEEQATAGVPDPQSGEYVWNCFDFTIVAVGVIQSVARLIVDLTDSGHSHSNSDTTLFRMLRLARTLRVLRLIRVLRFLKQLYLLAFGFVEGALAVFWVAVLTAAVVYLCAVILVRHYGRLEEGAPYHEFLVTNFHCVGRAMWTLFSIIASPSLEQYDEIIFEYPFLLCWLLAYVIFGSFGISGLLTGVISESIIDKNSARLEEQRAEREVKRKTLEEMAGKLYDNIDTAKSGNVHKDEFINKKDNILFMLNAACDVNIENTSDFGKMFELMDYDDSGTIEKEEFVHCVLEICDEVRPMSIMEVHSQLSQMHTRMRRMHDKVDRIDTKVKNLEHPGDQGPPWQGEEDLEGEGAAERAQERRRNVNVSLPQVRMLRQEQSDLDRAATPARSSGGNSSSSDKSDEESRPAFKRHAASNRAVSATTSDLHSTRMSMAAMPASASSSCGAVCALQSAAPSVSHPSVKAPPVSGMASTVLHSPSPSVSHASAQLSPKPDTRRSVSPHRSTGSDQPPGTSEEAMRATGRAGSRTATTEGTRICRPAKELLELARSHVYLLEELQQEMFEACEGLAKGTAVRKEEPGELGRETQGQQDDLAALRPHYVEALAELGNDLLELSRSNSWALAAEAVRRPPKARS